ncbi:MAG: DUF2236 domain-containing protein [Bacteroidetes bacterium]|nr:MAG: DUF2236 domain-containing protein [Bacteroidota bacterium]
MQWSDAFLDAARGRTDPAADQAVASLVAELGPSGAHHLFDTLIRQVDLPPADLPPVLADFVHRHSSLPSWADAQQLRRAGTVFLDHGPKFLVYLYYLSLPTLYSCAKGAQVLALTGRLMPERVGHERFSRRIAETGQFILDVMSPGGLQTGGKGIATTLRVRLIHAAIRHFLPPDRWETAWGRPINQEDLALTLMTFCISMFRGLERTGIALSPPDAEAYFHAWRVVGYLLGVEEELLPEDVAAGTGLHDRILGRQLAPSAAGRELVQALIHFAEQTIPGQLFDQAPYILIRHLAGEAVARALAVAPRQGCLFVALPPTLRAWLGWVERWEDLSEPSHEIMDRLSQKLVHGMVAFFNDYKGETFRVPPGVQQAWHI